MPNLNEWMAQQKIFGDDKGAGDTIKRVTDSLGIKQCGKCKERQQKLNEMFPYKRGK